jgi:predicted AlkP superfamily phosphohydrolase/phosphomutase
MLGIDSGSWNAMLPLLERGELPGFKRLMEEGSYGYLDAYGIVGNVLTPPSWTTIATGKTMEKHGISRFGQLSSEWRAAPVWTVLSQAGRAVGVVNWVCAWPPFKVKGVFISNPSPSRVGRLYLSPGLDAFAAAADSAITAAYRAGSDAGEAAADADEPGMGFLTRADITRSAESEIGFLWRIEREVISRQPPDFISYYYYAPDMVQHRFSKGLDRAEARGVGGGGMDDGSGGAGGSGRWGDGRPDRAGDDPVRWVWMAADSFLTDLMAGYGDDAWYLVVSDHGSREVLSGTAVFEMNALLVEMGCLKMAGGEIDSSASTCFLTAARAAYSKFHLKVNPSGGRANLPDRAGSLEETVSRIAGELRSIRVKETGHPIFERVDVSSEPGSADQPDIVAVAGKTILEMPKQETIVVVGAKEIDLRSLLIPHPWTAQHRARGIILAKGPGIRRHYSGAWTIADPYACIYPYLRGAVPATAWIGRVLRWLRVLDPATTLDVAPTLLYLLDLPVARDMDGRVLTELIDAQVLTARSVREVATYGVGTVADVDTSTVDREEVKKALKALGYLQ